MQTAVTHTERFGSTHCNHECFLECQMLPELSHHSNLPSIHNHLFLQGSLEEHKMGKQHCIKEKQDSLRQEVSSTVEVPNGSILSGLGLPVVMTNAAFRIKRPPYETQYHDPQITVTYVFPFPATWRNTKCGSNSEAGQHNRE